LAEGEVRGNGEGDERLLRVPCDIEEEDELRLDRIREEIGAAFDALRDVDDGVSLFGSARVDEGHPWYELTRETAACLTDHGYTVITGGGPGLMEAANRGAAEAGGETIGLNIELPHEQATNPYVKRFLHFHYFFARKLMFVRYARALEDNGLISPVDKELIVICDEPHDVCQHVIRASERQRAEAK
jgi:predicted Rossmann-fold nucleotide-binding protein